MRVRAQDFTPRSTRFCFNEVSLSWKKTKEWRVTCRRVCKDTTVWKTATGMASQTISQNTTANSLDKFRRQMDRRSLKKPQAMKPMMGRSCVTLLYHLLHICEAAHVTSGFIARWWSCLMRQIMSMLYGLGRLSGASTCYQLAKWGVLSSTFRGSAVFGFGFPWRIHPGCL